MSHSVAILYEIDPASDLTLIPDVFARKIESYAETFDAAVSVDQLRDPSNTAIVSRLYELRFDAHTYPTRHDLIEAEESSCRLDDDHVTLQITSLIVNDREILRDLFA